MPVLVLILGTSHPIQVGADTVDAETLAAFRQYLLSIIRDFNVDGIAEEMSIDGLKVRVGTSSIAYSISDQLGLSHLYADPSIEEQNRIGILPDHQLKMNGFFNCIPNSEVELQIDQQNLVREKIWLEKLKSFPPSRVLFICGSNHASRFAQLVQNAGIEVNTIAQTWQPNNSMHRTPLLLGGPGDAEH